jgi:hypothetical protein
MSLEKEVYFKYEDSLGYKSKIKISGYCYPGEVTVSDFGEKEIPPGKIRVLKCKCGANDWSDNGNYINEYECNCCGQFIEVYEKKTVII